MKGRKSGALAAFEQVMAAREGLAAPVALPRQLPLPETGAAEDAAPPPEGARGPGRPPGAANKRTEAWMAYLLARHRSPLLVFAETYSRPVAELAEELDCSLKEAFDFQLDAAKALAPYLHQKQPVAVEVDASGVVQLVIGEIAGGAVAGDDAVVIDATVIDGENGGKSDT